MGRGVVLKFRTFPDGGRGVVCESSDVRKFLKKSKFQNFSELFKFKVKTRNYNRSRFQYESINIDDKEPIHAIEENDQAPIVSAGEFLKLPFVTDDE